MTKVIILGEQPQEEKKLKHIEFTGVLRQDLTIGKMCTKPGAWDAIELICKDYRGTGNDLFLAYMEDGGRNDGILYLGHYDGAVE